jgi:hypothetical protein
MRIIAALLAVASLVGFGVYEYRFSPVTIGTSPGGSVFGFIGDYDELRRSGRPVRIDGLCVSACTLLVGEIPPDRICVTPYAKLAFHSAKEPSEKHPDRWVFSPDGTRILWQMYPDKVQALLRRHGWEATGKRANHPDLIYIKGKELLSLYRAC